MEQVVTALQMKEIEAYTIETLKIPAIVLMERAALAVTCKIEALCESSCKEMSCRVLFVCGMGNNGADGLASARMLKMKGYSVEILFVGKREKATKLWETQKEIIDQLSIPGWDHLEQVSDCSYDIIVDAIFGIGLAREVSGVFYDVISFMNQAHRKGAKMVAVDVPSGLSTETGQPLGICVEADYTVTFQYQKLGMLLFPGVTYAGTVEVKDVGIVSSSQASYYLPKASDALSVIPPRRLDTNKGSFGKVLVIAGSEGMCGAAYFAAAAAYRCGAGLVRIYTANCNRVVLQSLLPEAMISTRETTKLEELISWASVICMGPGIGTDEFLYEDLSLVLSSNKPCILDADALNLIAMKKEYLNRLGEHIIITPHLGEMARLCACAISELKSDLCGAAVGFAAKYHVNLVLKDAHSIVALPNGDAYIITTGNPGMSTGGSGDVLCGMIAGLISVGTLVMNAAYGGAVLHGMAGECAKKEKGMAGMLASDLLHSIYTI